MTVYITKCILTSGALEVPEGRFKIEEPSGFLIVRTNMCSVYRRSEYVVGATPEEARVLLDQAFEKALEGSERRLKKALAKLETLRKKGIQIGKPDAPFRDVD